MKSVAVLAIYALISSLGLTLMKKGLNSTVIGLGMMKSPLLASGFFLYLFSFILWLKILKENELSFAFPIASAALFFFVSLFSSYLLHEHISNLKIAGMVLIITGLFFVARG